MGVALSIWELRGDVQVNFNLGTNGLALSENVCHGASYNLRKAAWVPITGFILSHHPPPHTHTLKFLSDSLFLSKPISGDASL